MYDSESSSEAGWIEWFCDLEGHEFFVAVSIYSNSSVPRNYDDSTLFMTKIMMLKTMICDVD